MIKPKKLKDETIEAYNERASKLYYGNGYHIKEIASKLKLNEVEVYNYIVKKDYRITSESERQEMIKLYNSGCTYSEIARVCGRSRSCVRDRINSAAKIGCESGTTLNDRQLKKMKDMYDNGATLEAIAEKLRVPLCTVKFRLRHIDTYRTLPRVTKKEVAQFVKLRKNGKTIKEIAETYNRCVKTVSKHLKAAGL